MMSVRSPERAGTAARIATGRWSWTIPLIAYLHAGTVVGGRTPSTFAADNHLTGGHDAKPATSEASKASSTETTRPSTEPANAASPW